MEAEGAAWGGGGLTLEEMTLAYLLAKSEVPSLVSSASVAPYSLMTPKTLGCGLPAATCREMTPHKSTASSRQSTHPGRRTAKMTAPLGPQSSPMVVGAQEAISVNGRTGIEASLPPLPSATAVAAVAVAIENGQNRIPSTRRKKPPFC